MKRLKTSIILFAVLLLIPLSSKLFSQSTGINQYFEKDAGYDIYYDANDSDLNVLKRVRIINLIEIGEAKFLEITGTGFSGKEKKGYIRFNSIKAILPNGYFNPEQSFPENNSKRTSNE
ncbi:MAG: hypothetical protein ABH952_08085 [Candidatus Omnitrophota bacterium]